MDEGKIARRWLGACLQRWSMRWNYIILLGDSWYMLVWGRQMISSRTSSLEEIKSLWRTRGNKNPCLLREKSQRPRLRKEIVIVEEGCRAWCLSLIWDRPIASNYASIHEIKLAPKDWCRLSSFLFWWGLKCGCNAVWTKETKIKCL